MKEKLANMILVAERYIPYEFTRFELFQMDIMDCLPTPGTPSSAEAWAGRILAVMLILLTGVLVSYLMAAHASGISLIYVILRKRKDDENMLEWEDETFEDEPVAPSDQSDDSGPDTSAEADSESDGSDEGDAGEEEEEKGEGGE